MSHRCLKCNASLIQLHQRIWQCPKCSEVFDLPPGESKFGICGAVCGFLGSTLGLGLIAVLFLPRSGNEAEVGALAAGLFTLSGLMCLAAIVLSAYSLTRPGKHSAGPLGLLLGIMPISVFLVRLFVIAATRH